MRHTKNADSLIWRLPELVDPRKQQFLSDRDELRQRASTPCSMFRSVSRSSRTFANQLQGMVKDVHGDKSTARPEVLEDLPAWPSVLQKFEGDAIVSTEQRAVEQLGVPTKL